MQQTRRSLAGEFKSHALYQLDTFTSIPSDKVIKELEKEGWRFVPTEHNTPESLEAIGTMGIPSFTEMTRILSADGQPVFAKGNEHLRACYESDKQRLAADIHGTNIRPLGAELKARLAYFLSTTILLDEQPLKAVADALVEKGWKFQRSLTEQEVKNIIAMSGAGHPAIPLNGLHIISPEGQDVFASKDKSLRQRYRNDVKAVAAQVYGLNPT